MRIAIPGGAGFIGRHVARLFAGLGAQILTIDLREPDLAEGGEDLLVGDLAVPGEAERLASRCGHVDAMIWLAAVIRHVPGFGPDTEADLRLMASAPLSFLGPLRPVPAVTVYLSSIQVYGKPRSLPVDESHPTEPEDSYGAAKLCAEHYLRIACAGRGSAFAALRAAFVYGPGQHPGNVIPRFLAALRGGKPPVIHGDGEDVRDDVYVRDVARAVARVVERRASGVYNIASGKPHTLRHVAETACRVSGTSLQPRHEEVASGWVDRWFDPRLARRQLGFEATTSLEEGMREMWLAAGDG